MNQTDSDPGTMLILSLLVLFVVLVASIVSLVLAFMLTLAIGEIVSLLPDLLLPHEARTMVAGFFGGALVGFGVGGLEWVLLKGRLRWPRWMILVHTIGYGVSFGFFVDLVTLNLPRPGMLGKNIPQFEIAVVLFIVSQLVISGVLVLWKVGEVVWEVVQTENV